MDCHACGHPNPDDANYCGNCGRTLASERPCPSCGRSNPTDLKFCRGCGARLDAPAEPPPPATDGSGPPRTLGGGRYVIRDFLGEGGRKRVYLARDAQLKRDVAVALVKTEGLDESGRLRIRREAQAMAQLGDHPHVVTVHDIGEEDGATYIVSQYMPGGALEALLDQAEDRRLPAGQAIAIAGGIARALEHAHRNGIVHRDLKPANVWLAEDGTAKLGDFGLAFSLEHSRVTKAGMIVGTAKYMAPEQALGDHPGAPADLYSLGAMLYEMVTGRPPFVGDDVVSVISQHVNAEPVAPSWHVADIPGELEDLILALLAKDPEERPGTAAEVAEALVGVEKSRSRSESRSLEENPVESLASGVFVGREHEVDRLRGNLEDALAGHGKLTMLVGEPGSGTSRTAQEIATYAGVRGARVLVGRCYEGEGVPAFWPWVQMARTLIEQRDPEGAGEGSQQRAADIGQVLEDLRERIPGLEGSQSLDPEQRRFRFFDGITTYLKNAAGEQPLMLLFDDLHWADTPSVLLLQFLARELEGAPIFMLGTYRDMELGRGHPLAQSLAELSRDGLLDRVVLRGLSEADVGRYIEVTANLKPDPALVRAIHEETEGNPFFVGEVVSLLASDGRLHGPLDASELRVAIPQGVKDAVGQRLDRLSEDCNRVLQVASVVGREFGLDVVGRVAGIHRDRLLEVLDEAAGARVVGEAEGIGRFRFLNALMRDSLYDELGVTQRVRLHREVGDAIEAICGPDLTGHQGELAHHYLQAQSLGKAVSYSIRAAERSVEGMAYEAGARLYQQALEVLELRSPGDAPERCRLLLALGDAQSRAGMGHRAQATFRSAADVARRLGSEQELAQAALGVGTWIEIGLVDRDTIDLLEEALETLGESDSPMRARLLAKLGKALYFSQSDRREGLSREAVEMARRLGDPVTLAETLSDRHFAIWGAESAEERLAAATEMIEAAEQAGERELAIEGRGIRLLDLLELGDIASVDVELERYASGAKELRQPTYRRLAVIRKAMRATLAGRFDEVPSLLEEPSVADARRALDPNTLQAFGIATFEVNRRQGRFDDLEKGLKAFVHQYPAVPAWRAGLAVLYSEQGREADARREFEQLAQDDFQALPHDANTIVGLTLLAETCAYLGDRRRAEVLYGQLLPYAKRNAVAGAGFACLGSASRYLGLLATTLERYDDAERHYEEASQMNERIGARPLLAHTRHEYAEMLARRDGAGDRERALELVGRALDGAREVGMRALVDRALALTVRLQGLESVDVRSSIDFVASAVEEERPDLRRASAPDGTVTMLFSDIEGSTEMTERLGDRRWLEVLRGHNELIRANVAAHGGFEVKSQGDGFMVAFSSARTAVDCAIAIQRALAEQAEDAPQERIRVRMGLHTGEAIRDEDDFFGRNVILAARIAAQATGGEILVSALLKALTESAGDIPFGDARELELKGLSGRHLVHPVRWEGARTPVGR